LDADDALVMLRKLQGQTHQVITSVALVSNGTLRQATDITSVTFSPRDDDFLRAYIATGEPMDKAGAYGIQGYGAALVERSTEIFRRDGAAAAIGARVTDSGWARISFSSSSEFRVEKRFRAGGKLELRTRN
jgi:hypothetical protein